MDAFLEDPASRDLSILIRQAAEAGATDILFAPGARVGKIIVRSGGESILSRVVEPAIVRRFSDQVTARSHLAERVAQGGAPLESVLSSFELEAHDPIHVRVICTPTPAGAVLRLRLQRHSQLASALSQFQAGLYGGRELLPFLHSPSGVVLVAGPVSSGKTSALHHVAAELPGGVAAILSEAREFDPRGAARPSLALLDTPEQRLACAADLPPGAVIIDEMDDADKLDLAMAVGATRLVLASVVAPNLETSLRRAQASLVRLPERAHARPLPLVGVLRVGWNTSAGMLRRPRYAWFAFDRHDAMDCPCCGNSRTTRPCRRCGNTQSREELGLIPENVVRDVGSLESFRAGQRLHDPIESCTAGPVAAPAQPSRPVMILDQKGGGWTWPIPPARN